MHTTFVSPAFGFLFTTLIHAASAGVAPQLAARQDSSQLICTDDDVFKALFSNSGIAYEATSFCEHLIGLTPTTTCIAYNTTRTTVFPSAITTLTITAPTTVPSRTVIVTETDTVFGLRKRDNEAARAAITNRASFLQPAITAANIRARAASSSIEYDSLLSSACSCDHIDLGTDYITCNGPTTTITDEVRTYVTRTIYHTLTSGVTTITETLNVTSKLQTTSVSSGTSTWTISSLPRSSSTEESTTSLPLSTTTSASSFSTTATNGTWTAFPSSSTFDPTSVITTTFNSSTTIISTSSNNVKPTGCPGINGTITRRNQDTCTGFERICGRTYSDDDFYDAEQYFPTPEACAAVCEAENAGAATPCLGVVWNTTSNSGSPNCRQLRSTSTPLDDVAALALIVVPLKNCGKSSTTTTTITTAPTSSHVVPTTSHVHWNHSTWQPSGSWSRSGSWSWSRNWTDTTTTMSTTLPWTMSNTTTSGNPTQVTTTPNISTITTSFSFSTPWRSGSGTGSVGPSSTTNSSCLAHTIRRTTTVYATLFDTTTIYSPLNVTSTIYSTETDTVTVTSTTKEISVDTISVTTTTTETDSSTATVTSTITTNIQQRVAPTGNWKWRW